MKEAFDLHGTLCPTQAQLEKYGINKDTFLKETKRALEYSVKGGIEIWIISGPPKEEILNELTGLGYEEGVHFHEVRSVVDFLKLSGVDMWQDSKNHWWANDEDWWSSKAKICEENNIDSLTDDRLEYKPYFDDIRCNFHIHV